MSQQGSHLDEHLKTWKELASSRKYTGLLIGNGASLSVWSDFSYPSLYEVAKSENTQNRLSNEDLRLFDSLDTKNFEHVLSALAITRLVKSGLGENFDSISERYSSIQNALVEAVKSKHVPWLKVLDETLISICNSFLKYKYVYSTNYDLLAYWARMKEPEKIKDFLWSRQFNLADTGLWGSPTVILYLHGGLHLYRTPLGETLKRQSKNSQNLLDLFGKPMEEENAVPLFIAEGKSKDKLRSIYHSDYLTFAYTLLMSHQGALCIFGHSLGDSDQHIIDAIKNAHIPLAFSIKSGPKDEVISKKAALIHKLPNANIEFFDAMTHPLGSPKLKIQKDTP
jgi:Domain of unknown function (DUF4917)